jgi:hypothetical protein
LPPSAHRALYCRLLLRGGTMAVVLSRLHEEGHMPNERPLEGHFACGGAGGAIMMTADCLGREFKSRNHKLRFHHRSHTTWTCDCGAVV